MKKPPENLPPLKEEVRKIGSRKDGTSMKRLLEGIDRVRELMVVQKNSTPIRMQCDAVVASSGGGVCHDPPDTPADRDPSRQPTSGARGRLPKQASRQRGRQQLEGQPFQLLQQLQPLQLLQQSMGRQFQALERLGRTWGRLVEARSPFLEDLEACLVGMDLGACI